MTVRWVAIASGQGGQRQDHLRRLEASLLRDAWQRAMGGRRADAGALADNRIAQPTLVAWQLDAYGEVAARLPPPVLMAGYSVGEIAACAIAGGMAPGDAIDVAAERARTMDAAAPFPCALAAILGLSERDVDAACARHGTWIAIRNGMRHFIVGGARDKVQRVSDDAHAAGATRAHLLSVRTPAHTPMLEAAVTPFAHVLERFVHAPLRIPMISGIDASRIANRDEVIAALSRQLATRLDWAACMDAIGEMQPDAVLEIGPGNAIARMFADAWPDVPVRAIDDFRDLAAASAWVSAQRR